MHCTCAQQQATLFHNTQLPKHATHAAGGGLELRQLGAALLQQALQLRLLLLYQRALHRGHRLAGGDGAGRQGLGAGERSVAGGSREAQSLAGSWLCSERVWGEASKREGRAQALCGGEGGGSGVGGSLSAALGPKFEWHALRGTPQAAMCGPGAAR